MKTIDINKQVGVKLKLYPDNQPHVKLVGINPGDTVRVICRILDSQFLINILQVASALDYAGIEKGELHIPYLMAARSDRVMESNDSFDLEVVANMINAAGFSTVILYDVHSPIALDLIENSINISNSKLVDKYRERNSVLICPDKGAREKSEYIYGDNSYFSKIVYCEKDRDLATGAITLKVINPEDCEGCKCVIIDDLCDGGGTFLAIADQIRPESLTLIVTHGLFTRGFNLLHQFFDRIITSDSYKSYYDCDKVEVVNLID